MNILLIALGAALFVNGIVLCVFSNFDAGMLLTVLAGLFFLGIGIGYSQIKKLPKHGAAAFIKKAVCFCVCAELLLAGFIFVYGQNDNAAYDEDAVIVLGAGLHGDTVTFPLKMRLDTALEYYRKNPGAVIVVSGGMGSGETVTEAYAMEKYLLKNGVNKESIIKEEAATSTSENIRFSKKLLDERLGENYNTVIVTNGFHMYRSMLIAKAELSGDIAHMHAGLQWYNTIPCYLRESLAVIKTWIFG